jgi:uncharacterized protein (TIGR02186 family)
MRARTLAGLLCAGLIALAARPAAAERLVMSLSTYRVSIASNFTGADLVLFGTVQGDTAGAPAPRDVYDLVVTVIGPRQQIVTRRKDRVLGIWVNIDSRTFVSAPAYLSVLANRQIEAIAPLDTLRRLQVGLRRFLLPQEIGGDIGDSVRDDPFRVAFLRLMTEHGLYREQANGVTFLAPNVFRAAIPLPADAPIGPYEVDVKLFAEGGLVTRDTLAFESYKVGFEQFVTTAARDHALFYGVITAMVALLIGWLASVIFRRD